MVRVTRRRFVLGLLNCHSILYLEKGHHGGSGGYKGSRWHTAAAIRALLAQLAVDNVLLRATVVAPGGGVIAKAIESMWPRGILLGGFLAASGDLGGAT
jgi:hypothetical protein